ncbi:hypothetical protein [uncultured Thalassospira sp.]|uniref:hypothetical protein n=1 Tax=uncultured Thalassospira sp. TaxID=404382 RepID=UPI002583ED11|nr:hypothetical protein [uncultured Thalassospira sp.]
MIDEYVDGVIAVILFVSGYVLSQFFEKRKQRRDRLKQSAVAIVPLIGEWHHLLSGVVSAIEKSGYNSVEFARAQERFDSERRVAMEIDHHLVVLKRYKEAQDLVTTIHECLGSVDMQQQSAIFGHQIGELANIPQEFIEHSTPKIGSYVPVLQEFEMAMQKIAAESGNLISKL